MAPVNVEDKRQRNKDYCKKYRETHKDKYRQSERERKAYNRMKVKQNPQLYKLKKAEDRERKKLYRLRKKLGVETVNNSSTQTPSPKSFTTKQALNRSLKKVERALPYSPRKKTEVIGSLAQKFQLRISYVQPEKRGPKKKELNEEQLTWLETFLNRSDVTYMTPGRKDNVYVGKINGERQYVQKRYLLWAMRDVVDIANGTTGEGIEQAISFKETFGIELTFVQLYNYLKIHKEYIFNKDIPHGSCLCEICENAVLLAKGMSKNLSNASKEISQNPHELVEQYSCDSNGENCMFGICEVCKVTDLKMGDFENNDDEGDISSEDEDRKNVVSFYKWGRQDGKVVKQNISIDVSDAIDLWNDTMVNLKSHIHRKRRQVASYNSMKKNLDFGEIIIHVDYSESYKNAQQNEIQSAYFGHVCFSIFTACCYYKNSENALVSVPITITSETSDHSRIATFSCVNRVIQHMQKILHPTKVRKVFAWSDGAASQFRSKFVFMLMTYYDIALNIEWHYNESHHGKGPMDGVGGTVKNVVFRKVKSGKALINSPQEFAACADELVPSITSLYLPLEQVMEEPEDIQTAPKVPNTLKVHKVVRKFTENGVCFLEFFHLSDQVVPTYTHFYPKRDDPAVCGHSDKDVDANTCGYCMKGYTSNETEEWLQCPACSTWFHESCFHII